MSIDKKKVLVAMSGGVDSSVAAACLKKDGFFVAGITMCLGLKGAEDRASCCGAQAIDDARRVCDILDIPHYVLDFSEELEERVINPFIQAYREGKTPHPCIECNRSLKFNLLLRKALSLGFDYLATGHYAALAEEDGRYVLKRPKDRIKDQTYFLYSIPKDSFSSLIFPLAPFTKDEVRCIARDERLPVAEKPQSQDICFIPQGDYRKFIRERIKETKGGKIINTKGEVLGEHQGILAYTIGQREGLGLSAPRPLYVIAIDAEKNQIVVGHKEDTRSKVLLIQRLNRLVDEFPSRNFAQIRYNHPQALCTVSTNREEVRVVFDEAQEAITPGQSVVFYYNNIVLGGGIIERVLNEEGVGIYHGNS